MALPLPHPAMLRKLHCTQDIALGVRCGTSLLHPPSRELAVAVGIGWGVEVGEWPLAWAALCGVLRFPVPRSLSVVLALWDCSWFTCQISLGAQRADLEEEEVMIPVTTLWLGQGGNTDVGWHGKRLPISDTVVYIPTTAQDSPAQLPMREVGLMGLHMVYQNWMS